MTPGPAATPWLGLLGLLALLGLGACLKDHPLLLPENAYDPSLALRSDSLSRFDTVEIVLVDVADSTRVIQVFRGRLVSVDDLEPRAAGDGRTLVYVVRGWSGDRGQCYLRRATRDGVTELVIDSCIPKSASSDTTSGPGGRKPVLPGPPRFLTQELDFGTSDTSLPVELAGLLAWPHVQIEADPSLAWLRPRQARPGLSDTQSVACEVSRVGLAPGEYAGALVLRISGAGADTLFDTIPVRMAVPRPPGGLLRGRVVSAGDGSPEAGWTVRLVAAGNLADTGTKQMTGEDGTFRFGRVAPGEWELDLAKAQRIGRTLRVRIEDGDSASVHEAPVLPAAELEPVPLAWERRVSAVVAAAGHALAPSSEFEASGQVAVFPLDNLSPSLQRYLDQDNCGDDPPEECSEAGDAVADSGAMYIAYPQSGRLGRVGPWRGLPAAVHVAAGLEPAALALDGGRLLALGRIPDGRLALGAYDAGTLSMLRVDTLAGLGWDGVVPLDRGPRLVSHRDAWYAVDGNGPAVKGRLIRIDKATGKVESRELPESEASDLAVYRDQVWVTFSAASARSMRAYAPDLAPLDSLELGRPAFRLAVADTGRLAGYAFLACEDNGVSVIEFGSRKVVGRLALPGISRPRALAVDAASARLLVTDGRKLYQAGY